MRSTIPFVALVAFAVINTAFLGLYLSSSSSVTAGPSATTGTLNTSLSAAQSTLSDTTAAAQSSAPTTTATSTSTVTNTVTNTVGVSTSATQSQSTAATAVASETSTVATTTATQTSTSATPGEVSSSASVTTTTYAPTTTLTTLSSSQTASNGNLGQLSGPSSTTTMATSSTGGAAYGTNPSVTSLSGVPLSVSVAKFFEQHSIELAPASWFAVGGMWIWRGRMRSKWTDLGFDSDVFGLFVKMKGAKTRIRLLDALSVPKDRLQLAEELGLDWKSVDRHVAVMKKYGFVDDKLAYGRVRMYQLTPMGVSLLKLMQELSREDKRDAGQPATVMQGEA